MSDGHHDAWGDPEVLASQLSAFARTVQTQGSPYATLVEVVRAAIELVPGCDGGSVSLVAGRHTVTSEAASDARARLVDALQEKYLEGPCLDAAYQHVTVRVDDLAVDPRWPKFAAAAVGTGVASMICFQLYVEGDNLGALNLLSQQAHAFTDESEHIGEMFAAHAALGYSSAQQHSKLTRNIRTQQLVGQAQGILMERHKMTASQAFAVLVQTSQQANVKVRDLASGLVHTGLLAGAENGDSPSSVAE